MKNIALVGNPNCGKTTFFNALTGSNHYVGNWPGVTVEKKSGVISYEQEDITIVDLPGIYSLSPYSLEEKISREFILQEDTDVIINIVNAANLERNLYLTMQLLEIGKPVVMALNMMDAAKAKGIDIDIEKLSDALNIPVIPVVAIKNKGLMAVIEKVMTFDEKNYERITISYGDIIEKQLDALDYSYKSYDQRWLGLKILENDEEICEKIGARPSYDYTETITMQKYKYVDGIIESVTDHICLHQKKTLTDRIDEYVTNKILGIPIFLGVMALMFYLTFNIGNIFVDYLDVFFNETLSAAVRNLLLQMSVSDWLISLVVDGIIGGVGGVLVFVPNIAILFFFISILEDSGYMARAAYVMDDIMRKIGLNGKAFIPLLMGFGCNVPAIMATKSLENERDRLISILINPFISCGARLPIYILFTSIFFSKHRVLVTLSLYVLGLVVAIVMAFIFRKTLFLGEDIPFIMELPNYQVPQPKFLAIHVWEKVKGYIIKAGTVIFVASVLIWFIINFNFTGMTDITTSFGASIGKVMAPIFSPLGFGDWRASLALITGIAAKEIVVANLAIAYGLNEGATTLQMGSALVDSFTPLSAYSFMVFSLLYTPCVATIGVIKRETNSWFWMFFSVSYQILVAWTIAFAVYQIGSIFL